MGRPSKLSDHTRAEVLRRLALGEKPSDLRKEYRISETTFRRVFSADASKAREVGMALATAELALADLPVSAQVSARNIADQLKGISNNLAEAALVGSDTARALAVRANRKLQALDDEDPEVATAALKSIGALHAIGNEASKTAMGLVSANKGKGGDSASTLEDLVTGRASGE